MRNYETIDIKTKKRGGLMICDVSFFGPDRSAGIPWDHCDYFDVKKDGFSIMDVLSTEEMIEIDDILVAYWRVEKSAKEDLAYSRIKDNESHTSSPNKD